VGGLGLMLAGLPVAGEALVLLGFEPFERGHVHDLRHVESLDGKLKNEVRRSIDRDEAPVHSFATCWTGIRGSHPEKLSFSFV
jgi:hypothetical protein